MKRAILIIVFIALAVAIVWIGTEYNRNISNQSQDAIDEQGAAAAQAQQQAMDNLKIQDISVGTGDVAEVGNMVTVNYTGTFDNGTKFDSSYDHGKPFSFVLGTGAVIKGWDLGISGMKVGGKRELTIPPELAYGPAGRPPVIPPNSTLHFTVELVSVSK